MAEAAYYIADEGVAAIIDPLRDVQFYLDLAESRGEKIQYIFETHFHADFVSGHVELAKRIGAEIIYGPTAKTDYPIIVAEDQQEFPLGNCKLKLIHTPGHTPESSCLLLIDPEERIHSVYTGDTLFIGDVGRPDLLDGKMTKEELASMLYDSLRNKIMTLPKETIVYPGHGAGSACGKNISSETESTIAKQLKENYALQDMSKDDFVMQVTEGLAKPPEYFFTDAVINKKGYRTEEEMLKEIDKELSKEAFESAMQEGAIILDSRQPDLFTKSFIRGSLNVGVKGQFGPWVGQLIDPKQKLVLVTTKEEKDETLTKLLRIGYENIVGYLTDLTQLTNSNYTLDSIENIEANTLKDRCVDLKENILDVRKGGEFKQGHIDGAKHICLSKLKDNLETLDKKNPYYVHCAGGYRSSIAVSLLKREGFTNVYNIKGGFASIQTTDLPLITE